MKFNVVCKRTYTVSNDEIKSFKEAMLEYLEEEMIESDELGEGEQLPYTIDDIPDKIVEKVLAEVIQDAFDGDDYYCSGVNFDEYFGSITLNVYEEGVRDCVYEAVANWRTEMEKI